MDNKETITIIGTYSDFSIRLKTIVRDSVSDIADQIQGHKFDDLYMIEIPKSSNLIFSSHYDCADLSVRDLEKIKLTRVDDELWHTIENTEIIILANSTIENFVFKNCDFVSIAGWTTMLHCIVDNCELLALTSTIKKCSFEYCNFKSLANIYQYNDTVNVSETKFIYCTFPLNRDVGLSKLEIYDSQFRYCKNRLLASSVSESDTQSYGSRYTINPADFMAKNFHHVAGGWVGFKVYTKIDKPYGNPSTWKLQMGEVHEEISDEDSRQECSYGISFGTLSYVMSHYRGSSKHVIFIPDDHAMCITVPLHNLSGKCRTSYLIYCGVAEFTKFEPTHVTAIVTIGEKRYQLKFAVSTPDFNNPYGDLLPLEYHELAGR